MKKVLWTFIVVLFIFSGCVSTKQVKNSQMIEDATLEVVEEEQERQEKENTSKSVYQENNPLNELQENGNTALGNSILAAVESGDFSEVTELLAQGADPNVFGVDGIPLTTLALPGGIPLVSLLLDAGADINANDAYGFTTLTIAIVNELYTDIAFMLLDSGADLFGDGDAVSPAPFFIVSRNSSVELTKRAIAELDDLNIKDTSGNPLLFDALYNINPEVVMTLLAAGADPHATTDEGLGLLEFLERNLSYQVQYKGWFPAIADIFGIDPLIREYSISDINHFQKKGYTALGRALYAANVSHDFSAVAAVLEQGADPNIINADGTPSIMEALYSEGGVEVVNMLIQAGADVNAKDSRDATPLMLAILFEDFESTSLLLDSGADLFATDSDGVSVVFMSAANSRDQVFLERMISELDDLNMKNKKGIPLLFAALRNEDYSKIVLDLLSAGADPYITTDDGKTLFEYITAIESMNTIKKMEWYPLLSAMFGLDLEIETEKETAVAEAPDWITELYEPDSQYFYVVGKGSNPQMSVALQQAKVDALNQAAIEKFGILEQYITEYIVENQMESTREYIQETVTKVSADIMITSSVTIDSYFDGKTFYVLTGIPVEYLAHAVNEAFEIIGKKVSE